MSKPDKNPEIAAPDTAPAQPAIDDADEIDLAMDPIVRARDVLKFEESSLAKLVSQRDDHESEKRRLTGRRRKIAHRALAGNDQEARRELDKLSGQTTHVNLALENLSAAIATAEARMKQAEAGVAHAERLAVLLEAQAELPKRIELARAIDQALEMAADLFDQYLVLGRRLNEMTGAKVSVERMDAIALRERLRLAMIRFHKHGALELDAPDPLHHQMTLADIAAGTNNHFERSIRYFTTGKAAPVVGEERDDAEVSSAQARAS